MLESMNVAPERSNHDRLARREHTVKFEPQLERCGSVMLAAELDEPNGIGDALRADVRMCHGAQPVVGCNEVGRSVAAAVKVFALTGTDGLAFPSLTVIGGAVGCGLGARGLWNLLPDGPATLGKVRMVK